MSEQLLQFIWKFGLFDKENARTTSGERIEFLSTGTQNSDAGPDFSNARICIGGVMWVGNVEVHVRASDWQRHHHNNDKAYDSVILHVVRHNDCEVLRNMQGTAIPMFVLELAPALASRYAQLMESQTYVPCLPLVRSIENFRIRMFLTRLAVERIEQRSARVAQLHDACNGDWEHVFLHLLFRTFGFGINAQPFEQLAQRTPASCIAKHRSSLVQLESLLLGQAGLLRGNAQDDYHARLQQEYDLLRTKFALTPMEPHVWKFLRTRPTNFPTIRIAQLAALLCSNGGLFARICEVKNAGECGAIFSVSVSEYWETHYRFGVLSAKRSKALGATSVERIVANTVSPTLFAYGRYCSNEELCDRAVALLEQISAEKNSVIEGWKTMGVVPHDMLEAQALLHLKREYCERRRCLQCDIGRQILINP